MSDEEKEQLRATLLLALRAASATGLSVELGVQMVRMRGFSGPSAADVREGLIYLCDKGLAKHEDVPRAIGKAVRLYRLTAQGHDELANNTL